MEEEIKKARDYITKQRKEIQEMFNDNKERRELQEIIQKQTEANIKELEREYKIIDKMSFVVEITDSYIKSIGKKGGQA